MILGLPIGANTDLWAQDYDARDYYPLEVGNSWIYGPRSSTTSYTTVISHSIQIQEQEYFIQEKTWFTGGTSSDTLRYSDDYSGVVRYWYGIEFTLFDFELNQDSVYTVPTLWPSVTPAEALIGGYEMQVSRTEIKSRTPFADNPGSYGLLFDIINSRDDESWMIFVPEIGLVQDYGIWHNFMLISANVKGTIITNVEKSPPNVISNQEDFTIFPNPSTGSFSLSLTQSNLVKTRVEICDLLGRQLESREISAIDFSNESPFFNLSRVAPGTYFVRVTQGRNQITKAVVILR